MSPKKSSNSRSGNNHSLLDSMAMAHLFGVPTGTLISGVAVGMSPEKVLECSLKGVDPNIVIEQRQKNAITAKLLGHSDSSIKRDVNAATDSLINNASLGALVGISTYEVARTQDSATTLGMLQGKSYGSAVRNSGEVANTIVSANIMDRMLGNYRF